MFDSSLRYHGRCQHDQRSYQPAETLRYARYETSEYSTGVAGPERTFFAVFTFAIVFRLVRLFYFIRAADLRAFSNSRSILFTSLLLITGSCHCLCYVIATFFVYVPAKRTTPCARPRKCSHDRALMQPRLSVMF